MTMANKTSHRTTCTNKIWPHTNGFNIWNAPIKQLQIDPKKSPTTTPLYTTKHAAVAVVVLAVCLVFQLERVNPFVKPPREILFRVGNYFVTDDEKATIKTVVGDEKVPTVIFSSGILQPVAQTSEPTYDHDRVTPLMLFWNAVVLTEWPIGHWSETEKIRAICDDVLHVATEVCDVYCCIKLSTCNVCILIALLHSFQARKMPSNVLVVVKVHLSRLNYRMWFRPCM